MKNDGLCSWCRKDAVLLSWEEYGWLCPGCSYCVLHGAPRKWHEDKPFTEEQKRLETWSKKFFAQAIHREAQ